MATAFLQHWFLRHRKKKINIRAPQRQTSTAKKIRYYSQKYPSRIDSNGNCIVWLEEGTIERKIVLHSVIQQNTESCIWRITLLVGMIEQGKSLPLEEELSLAADIARAIFNMAET